MENQVGKENIDKTALKNALNITKGERIVDSTKLNSCDFLQKYNALLIDDLVSAMIIYIFSELKTQML